MMQSREIVQQLSTELARRFGETEDGTTLLTDGTKVRIETGYYGGFVLQSLEDEGKEPDLLVTAMHSDEPDYLNPSSSLHISADENSYHWREHDETLPDWTLPILKNIVQIDR